MLVLAWLVLELLCPLCELHPFMQVVFRGFLLPCLAKHVNVGLAVLGSAFIFSALHNLPQDIVPLALLGIVWGALYAVSGNLLMPVLLHSFWNLLTFARLAQWIK